MSGNGSVGDMDGTDIIYIFLSFKRVVPQSNVKRFLGPKDLSVFIVLVDYR